MQNLIERLNALATSDKLTRVQRALAASQARGLVAWQQQLDAADWTNREAAQRDLNGAIEAASMVADTLDRRAA